MLFKIEINIQMSIITEISESNLMKQLLNYQNPIPYSSKVLIITLMATPISEFTKEENTMA